MTKQCCDVGLLLLFDVYKHKLGASPLDPSRGLSHYALWSSFTFSRLDQRQCSARAVDWTLQADTRDHVLQPAAVCRPPQQRESWHRQRHRHSWIQLRSL